jgi:hypothetical protein
MMAQKRESALQRIQVGVIGLVVVLLFVSLANMLMDSAIIGDSGPQRGLTETIFQEKAPDEPLAELGVAPVVDADEDAGANKASGSAQPKESPGPAAIAPGQ